MTKKTNLTDHEKSYSSIIELYDIAEEMLDSVDQNQNPEQQLDYVENLVNQLEEGADILSQTYRDYVISGKKPGVFNKRKLESTLGKVYAAIQQFEQKPII